MLVDSVTFCYKKAKRALFENYSLQLDKDGVYGLFGQNGTGKSTLLYLMMGLIEPNEGHVFYKGKNVWKRGVETLSDIYLVPEVVTFPQTTLKQYLAMYAPFYPRFSYEQMYACLDLFGLERNLSLKALSMGEAKKVCVSFALSTNCSFIAMDEPTNGLDIPAKAHFRRAISQMPMEGRKIVISTHQARDLEQIIDRLILIKKNQVVLNCSVAEIERHLFFDSYASSSPQALWQEPSAGGFKGLFLNQQGNESSIDVELLFNAMIQDQAMASRLHELFKTDCYEK